MKAEFKRDMYKSYMIFEENEKLEHSYELKMISSNSILGLLKLEVKIMDGERKYYYDITSLKALTQVFQKAKITKEQMVIIMEGILNSMERVRDFLLKEDNLILDPEFIFMNLSEQEIHLAYLPGFDRLASSQFENLLEFLMDRTDYAQEEAVKLSYALYKINRGKNYSVQEFREVLNGKLNPYEGDNIRLKHLEERDSAITADRTNAAGLEPKDTKKAEIKLMNDTKKGKNLITYLLCTAVIGTAFLSIWLSAKSGILLNPISGQVEITKLLLFLLLIGLAAAFLLSIIFGIGKQKINSIKEGQTFDLGNNEEAEYTKQEQDKSNESEIKIDERTTILTKEMADCNNLNFYLSSLNKKVYQDIHLSEFPFFIGKLKTNVDYVINNQAVSRFHAKIEKGESGFFLVDLNSTNGTFVNGNRLLLNERKEIYLGDEIMFADVAYNFIKL